MAGKTAKKKKVAPASSAEAHRVNMTFTPEEYEMLVQAGAKEMRPPTVMAKYLVMRALASDNPFEAHDTARGS